MYQKSENMWSFQMTPSNYRYVIFLWAKCLHGVKTEQSSNQRLPYKLVDLELQRPFIVDSTFLKYRGVIFLHFLGKDLWRNFTPTPKSFFWGKSRSSVLLESLLWKKNLEFHLAPQLKEGSQFPYIKSGRLVASCYALSTLSNVWIWLLRVNWHNQICEQSN